MLKKASFLASSLEAAGADLAGLNDRLARLEDAHAAHQQAELDRQNAAVQMQAISDDLAKVQCAVGDIGAEGGHVDTLIEVEREERENLWLRIERIERQMQLDAEQAKILAQAWIDLRAKSGSAT